MLCWFKKVSSYPLEHCDFVGPQGHYWRSPYRNKKLDHIQIEVIKVNPIQKKDTVVPTICGL